MDHSSQLLASKRRACLRCATAKAKCVVTENREGCDRCARLRRECNMDEAHRQKRKKSSRVEKLEQKVDDLLVLLTPAQSVDTATSASNPMISSRAERTEASKSLSMTPASNDDHLDVIDRGIVSISKADILLEKFKTTKMVQFPFVIIPPTMRASYLRRQCPFLFLTVMAASSDDEISLQRTLGLEVKQNISRRMVFGNEIDLELLQGLLIHVAFYHFHFHSASKQMYMFLQMCVSLVTDLNLDKHPKSYSQRVGFDVSKIQIRVAGLPDEGENSRTAAERRAFLGCYYLCLGMSMVRGQPVIPHTTWVDHCCRSLDVEREHPTDCILKSLIEAANLKYRISEMFPCQEVEKCTVRNEVLLEMSINTFLQDVSRIRAAINSTGVQDNYNLLVEMKFLAVPVYEIALHQCTVDSQASLNSSHLCTLLICCRDTVEAFLAMPTEALRHIPSTAFMLTLYCFIVLSDLVIVPTSQRWDRATARKEANVADLGRSIREKVGSLSTMNLQIRDKDTWAYFTTGMAGILAWHRKREQLADENTNVGAGHRLTRCNVRDVMGSCSLFVALHFRAKNMGTISDEQDRTASSANTIPGNGAGQEGASVSLWDDSMWDSLFNDFSAFPLPGTEDFQIESFASL